MPNFRCVFYTEKVDSVSHSGPERLDEEKKTAMQWFKEKGSQVKSMGKKAFGKLKGFLSTTSSIEPGQLVMFNYDPKWKKELPYYDTMPLIVVLGPSKVNPKAFLGLNMHYLSPKHRAAFFDKLVELGEVARNKPKKTRIKIQYTAVKAMSGAKFYKPTIKMYLRTHLKSRFTVIPRNEWEQALFLPTAQWKKASQNKIWSDSARMAGAIQMGKPVKAITKKADAKKKSQKTTTSKTTKREIGKPVKAITTPKKKAGKTTAKKTAAKKPTAAEREKLQKERDRLAARIKEIDAALGDS